MKSKILNKKPIDKNHTIYVSDIDLPQETIERHRQRINTIFANQTEEFRNEQLNKMIIHDVKFGRAMDYLVTNYEFEIDPEELNAQYNIILEGFKKDPNFIQNEASEQFIKKQAERLIIQKLVFDDIKASENIDVNDEELEKILLDYYKETNQPIRNFKQDKVSYENARESIIFEKIIFNIIGMFPFDFTEFNKKLEEFVKKNNLEKDKK